VITLPALALPFVIGTGVSACAAGRVDYRRDIPVDFDRISLKREVDRGDE
jgi:hypothetical protein